MQDIFSRDVLGASDEIPLAALALARKRSAAGLLAEIEQAGLVGKGGACYPTFRKVALMQRQPSVQRCLVVNGSEHEPGSLKDRHLLENYSSTVIEGALIMAHAVGATDVLFSINEHAASTMAAFAAALERTRAAGCFGHNEVALRAAMVAVPDAYIVGEETALIRALQGQPALPAKRPPFPIESGVGGAPTLVQNVETVAHLPYIIKFGAAAYRALGAGDGGVTLCTFGAEFARSGVRLVPLGVTLRDIVEQHGGGLRGGLRIKAVQPGGPSAGFLPASALDVKFDDASLKRAGSALGCAAIRAFSDEDDMVRVVAEQMAFFAAASCGQCPACRMTTQMLSAITKQILAGRGTPALLRQVPVLVERNAGKGICGFLKMPGPPMMSVLRHFPAELDRYLQKQPIN